MNAEQKLNLKSEAYQLYNQGYEPQDIISELGDQASQATIYRWLNEFKTINFKGVILEEHREENKPLSGNSSYSGEAGEKRSILKRFKKILKEISAYGEGHEWENAQLRTVLRTAERLQDEAEKVLEFDPVQFEDNAVWNGLEKIIDEFQDLVFKHPGEVSLYLTPDEKLEFEYYLSIEDFDQLHEEEELLRIKFESFIAGINNYVESGETFSVAESEDLLIATERIEESLEEVNMSEELSLIQDIKVSVEELVENANSSFIFSNAKLELPEEVYQSIQDVIND